MITERRISKRQLIALRGAKCEICGLTEWCGKPITFDDHHCDKNHANNVEQNRKIICHRQQHLEQSAESKKKNSEWHTGKRYSEETRRKMGNSHIGTCHSEETKQKIRDTKLGKRNPMYGKHFSEEARQKRSLKFSDGRNKGENNPMSKMNRAKRALQMEMI